MGITENYPKVKNYCDDLAAHYNKTLLDSEKQLGAILDNPPLFSKDQLDTMITDALKISRYDFSSLVYVRVLLEIEVCKLCAVNRTEEDLKNIENTLVELEEKFDTDLRVEKDFAFHQAIAQGGHNPVISSLLLIITPDILKYYQKYKV